LGHISHRTPYIPNKTAWLWLRSLNVSRSCSRGLIFFLFLFRVTSHSCTKISASVLLSYFYYLIIYGCYSQAHACAWTLRHFARFGVWCCVAGFVFTSVLKEQQADIVSHPWQHESPTQAHSFMTCVTFRRILLLKNVNTHWVCKSVAWLMSWFGVIIPESIPVINITRTNINQFIMAYGTWMPGAMPIGLRTGEIGQFSTIACVLGI
jgi:hypothetical protein